MNTTTKSSSQLHTAAAPVMLPVDLRDYFAAKAMEAAAINPFGAEFSFDDRASWAYKQADAMLAAREAA